METCVGLIKLLLWLILFRVMSPGGKPESAQSLSGSGFWPWGLPNGVYSLLARGARHVADSRKGLMTKVEAVSLKLRNPL